MGWANSSSIIHSEEHLILGVHDVGQDIFRRTKQLEWMVHKVLLWQGSMNVI